MGMFVQSHVHSTRPAPWLPAMFDQAATGQPGIMLGFSLNRHRMAQSFLFFSDKLVSLMPCVMLVQVASHSLVCQRY